jgi:hypothetical protein
MVLLLLLLVDIIVIMIKIRRAVSGATIISELYACTYVSQVEGPLGHIRFHGQVTQTPKGTS